MSDAGAGTSHGGSQGGGSQGGGSQGEGQQVDPGRKYGTIVNNNTNHWKCIFCYKVLTAGVSRLKQHLVGGYKNAKKCPICPEHVRVELQNYMAKRLEERVALSMQYQPVVNEDDVEDLDGDQPIRKAIKRKNRGPLDKFVMSMPPDILKGRKEMKGVFGACDKELRDKVCGGIARWFFDAGVSFNAVSHDSFKEMTELIGQYGMGLKPPSQYELRFPLLQKEVANVQALLAPNREEWAVKGCSIMSDGWRDSVVQKDIVNFLVNSPRGSVFIRSKEVSEVVKDATMLFKLLDDMVEEVGEKNVVQVVTDNASNYVKAGTLLEAKRPHLFWTPCTIIDSIQLGSSSGHSVDPDPGSSAAELSKCLAEPARKTEQGDFDEYGWANIGSFDDLDRMFSNDVPIFGGGSLSGADELWSSSKNVSNSPSKQLPLVLEPGDLGLDIRTEIEHQQFPLTGKANGPPSSQSVGITPKPERYHEHKGQPSVEDQIYQQTKMMKFSEMCGTSKAKAFHDPYGRRTLSKTSPGKFVNQLAPSQSSSNLQSHSQGSGTSHYPHIPNQYMSTSGFDNHTNPYSSSLFQRPATAISPNNASARPSTMTPQEKLEKLRRRQQMQAMLAIQRHQQQQFRHQVPLADQYITQNCCQDNPLHLVDKANLQGLNAMPSFDPSSSLEPGDSGNFADGVGNSSEFSVLYRLQDVVAKLDMGTRTCIRDSLFRLADSAGQRHHYASDKTIQDDQEVAPEEKSRFRYGGMLDTETVTNPTDRTVAHLLFHRPFDMSAAKHMEGGPESQASSKVGTGDKGKFPKCSTGESHINKQRAKEEEPPPAGSLDLGNASNSGSSSTVLVREGC